MNSSSIHHPTNEPLAMVRKWHLIACDDNLCAALLLSHFEHWHNWKLKTDEYNKTLNDISEKHGEQRRLSEDVWLFKSLQGLSDSILNTYSSKKVSDGLDLLAEKGFISIHTNPNPNHHYDKRKYFRFYPELCNDWLKNEYRKFQTCDLKNETRHEEKIPHRHGNISASIVEPISKAVSTYVADLSDEEKVPSACGSSSTSNGKTSVAIKEINNKKNQSTNQDAIIFDKPVEDASSEIENPDVKLIIHSLIEQGMPIERFSYPDTSSDISSLLQLGADIDVFLEAFDIAQRNTSHFGVRYLGTVVKTLLDKSRRKIMHTTHHPPKKEKTSKVNHFSETDISKASHWLEGI